MTVSLWIRRTCAVLACSAGLALGGTSADASPLFEHSGGLFGTSGLNARFTGDDTSAAYFNPGNLARAPNGINVGLFVMHEGIGISLDGRDEQNVDLPNAPSLRWPEGNNAFGGYFPTEDLYRGQECGDGNCLNARPRQGAGSSGQTRTYASVGLINRVIEDYLSVGIYAVLPLGKFTTTHAFFPDEREQFFSNSLHPEMYGDRLTAPSISIGVGSSPIPELSFGLAFTIALLNTANAGVFTRDAADLDGKAQLNARVGVVAKVAPHFAINYHPIPNLQLSATVHSPSRFDIGLNFSNILDTGDEQVATRTMTHDYNPWIFGFGAEYIADLGRFDLTLVGGLEIALWSKYINRHNERAGSEYELLGNMEHWGGFGWRNTITPSIGVRFGEIDNWSVGADYKYVASPVPEQTGRTNYVDNNKQVAALNVDYRFDAGPVRMGVGANVQGHFLKKRSHKKHKPSTGNEVWDPADPGYGNNINPDLVVDEMPDELVLRSDTDTKYDGAQGMQTNNPGWPGFSSSGALFGAGVHISLYY